MRDKLRGENLKYLIKFIITIAPFGVVGILLAFWFGMGWFLLLITIRKIIFTFPSLLTRWLRFTAGEEVVSEMQTWIVENDTSVKPSKSSLFHVFLHLLATILVFWQANIPLIDMIDWMVK